MSRLKSARGGSSTSRPAARAARPSATRGIYVQAARPGIYEALLGVALGAILLGTILMLLVLNRYEWKTKATAMTTAPATAALA